MSGLRTVWLVARWEFTSTLRRPSFVASLIGLPLTHFLLAALIGFSVQTVSKEDSAHQPIAVVDAAAVLSGTLAGRDLIVRDMDAALRALHTGQLAAVYVLHVDYLHSGRVDEYSRGPSSILQLGRQIEHRERVAALIRRGLLQDDSPRANRLVEPIASVNTYRVGDESISRESSTPILGLLAGPVGVCFVLGLAIFLAAGLLQQAMESEMQNRMLEVVLSIITPAALLTGKVAGLSAAGLLQLGVYLSVAVVAGPMLGSGAGIPGATLIWSGVVFVAGYILFAVLLAGSGALARDPQESTQVASLWLLLAAMPFFLITHIGAHPASMVARVLTWFPPTAPVALLLRIGFDGVGTVERTAATLAVLLSSLAALRVSTALFKMRALSAGRLTLRQVFVNIGGGR